MAEPSGYPLTTLQEISLRLAASASRVRVPNGDLHVPIDGGETQRFPSGRITKLSTPLPLDVHMSTLVPAANVPQANDAIVCSTRSACHTILLNTTRRTLDGCALPP